LPIYVRWNWHENTKTFLVIFYLLDDFSKPNLRLEIGKIKDELLRTHTIKVFDTTFKTFRERRDFISYLIKEKAQNEIPDIIKNERYLITWAPSHVELGLLSEVLSYANLINGLKENDKRELRRLLEIINVPKTHNLKILEHIPSDMIESVYSKMLLVEYESYDLEPYVCFELSPLYIDYLREVSKSYI